MAILDVGQLDRRVGIKTASNATNDLGESVSTYSLSATVWAKVEWVNVRNSSTEKVESGKESVFENVVFLIRYRTMDETMKLTLDSEDYDIKSIGEMTDRGRKRYLRIIAEKAS